MRIALLLLVSACGGQLPTAGSPATPCAPIALDKYGRASSTLTVDQSGLDLCLHLDGRAFSRSHLMADTQNADFALRLDRPDGTIIQAGWDVPVAGGTFENLEWSPERKSVDDVILHVATKQPAAKTVKLDIWFGDPFE
jgi:hypothetical protein